MHLMELASSRVALRLHNIPTTKVLRRVGFQREPVLLAVLALAATGHELVPRYLIGCGRGGLQWLTTDCTN